MIRSFSKIFLWVLVLSLSSSVTSHGEMQRLWQQFCKKYEENRAVRYASLISLTALETLLINSKMNLIDINSPAGYKSVHEFVQSNLHRAFPTFVGSGAKTQEIKSSVHMANFFILAALFYQNYKLLELPHKKDSKPMNAIQTLIVTPSGYLASCLMYFCYGVFLLWLSENRA